DVVPLAAEVRPREQLEPLQQAVGPTALIERFCDVCPQLSRLHGTADRDGEGGDVQRAAADAIDGVFPDAVPRLEEELPVTFPPGFVERAQPAGEFIPQ